MHPLLKKILDPPLLGTLNFVQTLSLYIGTSLDLVMVFDAILTSRQMCEKLQCLCKNLMSNNLCKMAVLKKL